MTPDKEEILDAADSNWPYDLDMETTTKKAAYEAMDVWGKQEAIGFWDWVGECDYTKSDGDIYIDRNPHGIKGGYYTPEQLYNLYLQSKNKE